MQDKHTVFVCLYAHILSSIWTHSQLGTLVLADSRHIQWMAHLGLALSLPSPILQTPALTYLPHYFRGFWVGLWLFHLQNRSKASDREVPLCSLAARAEDSHKMWMLCKADTAEVSRIICFSLGLTLPSTPRMDAYLLSLFAIIQIQCSR